MHKGVDVVLGLKMLEFRRKGFNCKEMSGGNCPEFGWMLSSDFRR